MAHAIEVRKIPFDFGGDLKPDWHSKKPEWGHMVNGASLTMPYLEPFLNRTMRDAVTHLEDEDLKQDVDGFIRQEAQHFGNHRRYNEILKQHYPELADVEDTFTADYEGLDQRSLEWRLAYAAGFETMTMGITEWLINDREWLFYGADSTVTSLVLWHMVEETEHKSVAYDVYQTVSGKYWLRIYGLLYGSLHVGFMSRRAYIAMLKRDGTWNKLTSRLKVWGMVSRFFLKAGLAMVRALLPGYHPDKVIDPDWVDAWRVAYSGQGEDFVPLLDTADKDIPPAFV